VDELPDFGLQRRCVLAVAIVELDRDHQSHLIIAARPTTSPNQNPELNARATAKPRKKRIVTSIALEGRRLRRASAGDNRR
jgi:hypothetical protein